MERTDRVIAYCGLECSACDAYVATQANDPQAIERVAAKWREEYSSPGIVAEGVWCDGCVGDGRKCFHCAECDIHACGAARGVSTCAACPEYPCERLTGFMDAVPGTRETLDSLRGATA